MTSLTDIASKIINRKGNENLVSVAMWKEAKELIEAAVLAEREACAKVCEDACAKTGVELVGKGFAAAIRARGEK